jgi:dolichyl-phosphate beta-glucosyltransferase
MAETKTDEIYLSIIISFFNEEARLEKTIKVIDDFSHQVPFKCELILSDDKSTDKSIEIAKKYSKEIEHFRYLEPKVHEPKGKGAGIQRGIADARGKYIMFMDADNSTPITDVEKLLPYIKDYDIVMGSRYIKEPRPYKPNWFWGVGHGLKSILEVLILGHSKDYMAKGKQGRFRQLVSRGGNFLFTLFLNQSYVDQRCGFKLYRHDAAKLLASLQTVPGFSFDTEYLTIAQKYHLKTIEVPVEWYDEAGSRVGGGDIIGTFKDIFEILIKKFSGRYSKKHALKKMGNMYNEYILSK